MHDHVIDLIRVIAAYSKTPDSSGEHLLAIKHNLAPINLSRLRQIFNINPNHPDAVTRDLIDCYSIGKTQAEALQPYVIDGILDLKKYDYMLECYSSDES